MHFLQGNQDHKLTENKRSIETLILLKELNGCKGDPIRRHGGMAE